MKKPTKKPIKKPTKITLQEMEKAIIATKKWTKLAGFNLDLDDMGLGFDCGKSAFYRTKEDAREDILEAFQEALEPAEGWIDLMKDGSLGEDYYPGDDEGTKYLYNLLKKDKIIK